MGMAMAGRIPRRILACLMTMCVAFVSPACAGAAEQTPADAMAAAQAACSVSLHGKKARIVCADSPVYARGKINCRMWPDQVTPWIKNGVAYSQGCQFGVKSVADPVTMEIKTSLK